MIKLIIEHEVQAHHSLRQNIENTPINPLYKQKQ